MPAQRKIPTGAVMYHAGHALSAASTICRPSTQARRDTDAEKEVVALEQVIATVGGARKLRLLMLDGSLQQ